MISKFTKKYIEKIAKDNKILKENINYDILYEYCKIVENLGYKLEFRKGRNLTYYKLNANAGFFKNSSIVVTPEWAVRLTLFYTEEVRNAFNITIGHELTHKEKEIFVLKYGISSLRFIAYVNEIHADFGGAQKMANSNKNNLINSMNYKKTNKNDMGDIAHPSKEKRLEYAKIGTFNNELIFKIAKDIKYDNKIIINKIANFYEIIELK